MNSLILQGITLDDLVDAISSEVMSRLEPALAKSAAPMLVDGDEMARLASVSRPTIDRLRAADEIPSIPAGRRRLYDPAAVIAALCAQEKRAADE